MNIDAILANIDGWGRYQKFIYFLLCIPVILAGSAVISLSWIGYSMNHRCFIPGCDSANSSFHESFLNFTTPQETAGGDSELHWSSCRRYEVTGSSCDPKSFDRTSQVSCQSFVYDTTIMHSSIVSQFDLVCDRQWLLALSTSLYMAGMLVGSLVVGLFSDRFGRKPAVMLSFITLGFGGMASAFAPNYETFAAMRFVTGIGGMGTFLTPFVLSLELVSNPVRTFCGFAIEVPFSFGLSLVGILALFIKDWVSLQIAISAPIFIFLLYWLIIPESPRWLIAEGSYDRAENVLREIARHNRTVFPDHLSKTADENCPSAERADGGESPATSSGSVMLLFRSPVLRRRTCVVLYQWFVVAMVYYGLAMNSTNLGGNVYVNFILVQLVDWPSIFCCMILLDPWGRKLCNILAFMMAGLGSIASGIAASGNWHMLTVALALVGKFGASAAFNIAFVYGAELFPTDLRSSGIGLASAAGRIGSILAPFIANLGVHSQLVSMGVIGALSLLAGISTLFLPETHGHSLPGNVAESEQFGRDQPLCQIPCCAPSRKTSDH